ncbi:MotA/TolQ/ExbB proton channel family protein [Methylomonas sp. AM2-LC]|uniref:MotA/TolQ/ExbB proton channel family protein n=1 Tax=Methylomonas sp. AM2-LC TaxID=3153301 RepID=UPI003266B904
MNFSETTIVDSTLCMLGCFSLLTWSVIILKAGEMALNRYRNRKVINQFADISRMATLTQSEIETDKSLTTQAGRVILIGSQTYARAKSLTKTNTLEHHAAWHELIERALRQQLQKEKALMESGLGWLASIGSTAPFIGLFGTVWGIMHALKDISAQGNASLDVVAGPIGEALIATALGIAVAIPAVIAYNFFLRQNRTLIANLEHFATDYLRSCIENDLTQTTENTHVHTTAQ